jgi:CubicO group peptidase (beta-lactamase class C family)
VASLSWDSLKLEEALNYAGARSSYGVIILQNGRIVKEKYWNSWNQDTRYYIASAGKSVVASLVGIAQQDGILNINAPSSTYLGTGWTSLTSQQEQLITVKHQLSMTTGLNENVPDDNCTTPSCLTYLATPGARWAYYNAPYRLLQNVLANASGLTFNQYAKQKLYDKIGMPQSFWFDGVMYCTTREAARFGSLILKKGKWDGSTILQDSNYFASMINSSQTLNNSYGYLWWLNGKSSYMVPTLQAVFPGSMAPNAPADMIMALGKDDKKIYVVPSLNLVVVRLGDAAGTPTLGPSSFDNEFWGKLKLAIGF